MSFRTINLVFCCLFGVMGCASSGQTYSLQKLTQQWPWSAKADADEELKVAQTDMEQSQESPFLPASQKVAEEIAEMSDDPLGHLDSATRTLVEMELKDVSDQERQQWVKLLKDVEPQAIPFILSSKKLAESQHEDENPSPIQLTGIEEGSNWSTEQVRAQISGTDPWQRNKPALQAPMPHNSGEMPSREPMNSPPEQIATLETIDESSTAQQSSSLKQVGYNQGGTQHSIDLSTLSGASQSQQAPVLQLIDHLQQTLSDASLSADQRTRYEVCLRLAYLMNRQQERALTVIDQLPADQQEYWQQVLFAVATSLDFESIPNSEDQATLSAAALRKALESLAQNAQLSIGKAVFCQKIDSFGSYDQFPLAEFVPGQVVLVYAEIENYRSDYSPASGYKTVLNSTMEIHRAGTQGGLISQEDLGVTEDFCRSPRHDYFHSYMVKLPDNLAKGPHSMKLLVEDRLAKKVAEYTLNFQVK